MAGQAARRNHGRIFAALCLVLVVGIGLSLWRAAAARSGLVAERGRQANLVAQTRLAPLLQPSDLARPIVGERAAELRTTITQTITAGGPIRTVTLVSSGGRVLLAADPDLVGTRPSILIDPAARVAGGTALTQIHGDEVQTFVPIRLKPSGQVVVAELEQPYGPIAAAANAPWYRLAIGFAALFLVSGVSLAITLRNTEPTEETSMQASQLRPHRELDEARREAERRATELQETVVGLRAQFKQMLEELKTAEARLTMRETEAATAGEDLRAIRQQLHDTSGRFRKAELDNNALRERLALRSTELDAVRGELQQVREADPQHAELTKRLQASERRAKSMAKEIARLETELVRTTEQLHLSKLSEALREFDLSIIVDEEELAERPRVIATP